MLVLKKKKVDLHVARTRQLEAQLNKLTRIKKKNLF